MKNWACSRRFSTAGRRSSSRTERPPSSRRSGPTSGAEAGTDRVSGEEDPDQGRGAGRVDGGAYRAKKKSWGTLTGVWVPHDMRDQIVDFVRRWSEKTEIGAGRFIVWLGVTASKFYDWRRALRQGQRAQRLGSPGFLAGGLGEAGDHDFHLKNPLEGYRRLTFMMLDADIVAVSPASVWRVLSRRDC